MSGVKVAENLISKPDYIITAQELINNEITEIPWFWSGFIPQRGITFISGSTVVGKSTIGRQLSIAVVTEEVEYLGRVLSPTYRSVIYVSTEDDLYSISPKIKREIDFFRSGGQYGNLRFIFDYEKILEKLKREFDRQPADCIILDSFGDIYGGDVNNPTETRRFMNEYKSFSDEAGCAIVFIHHNRKTAKGNPDKHDLLGSMALEAKARSVLMLSQANSIDRRILTVVKGNYLTPEEQNVVHELSFVDGIFDIVTSTGRYISTSTDVEMRALAYKYKEEGRTYSDITELLRQQGYITSRSSIGRLLKH